MKWVAYRVISIMKLVNETILEVMKAWKQILFSKLLKDYCVILRKDCRTRAAYPYLIKLGKGSQVDFIKFGRITIYGKRKKWYTISMVQDIPEWDMQNSRLRI